ncbi:MAG TPA: 3'-5' exonuclease [Polyangiaceae bacterium]
MRGATLDVGCFPTGRHYPGIAHLLRVVAAGLVDGLASDAAIAGISLVAIDTETTGRDPNVDRVVEVACVVWRDGAVVERKSWLVNPGRPIPQEAFEVHGIGDEHVKDAPAFAQILGELCLMTAGHVPVAYNAEYDRTVLSAEIGRVEGFSQPLPAAFRKGIEWIDPLVWARELQKLEKSRSLGDVVERLGIKLENAHRAADDAEATLHVLHAFLSDSRVPRQYGAFVQEQRRLARQFDDERVRWRR